VDQRARGGEGQLYFWHQAAGEVLDANAVFQDKFDSVARVKRHKKRSAMGNTSQVQEQVNGPQHGALLASTRGVCSDGSSFP
jgi:hypothetical protein